MTKPYFWFYGAQNLTTNINGVKYLISVTADRKPDEHGRFMFIVESNGPEQGKCVRLHGDHVYKCNWPIKLIMKYRKKR